MVREKHGAISMGLLKLLSELTVRFSLYFFRFGAPWMHSP